MAFVYDTFVTGKNFIGRKAESNAVRNLLGHGTSVCIYEPPKAGKMSVIQQALFNMRLSGVPFTAPQADLFNCRDTRSLALKLASSIIRSAASTPAEYAGIIETMLKDTRFHFDQTAFSENDEVVCLDGNPDIEHAVEVIPEPVEDIWVGQEITGGQSDLRHHGCPGHIDFRVIYPACQGQAPYLRPCGENLIITVPGTHLRERNRIRVLISQHNVRIYTHPANLT